MYFIFLSDGGAPKHRGAGVTYLPFPPLDGPVYPLPNYLDYACVIGQFKKAYCIVFLKNTDQLVSQNRFI